MGKVLCLGRRDWEFEHLLLDNAIFLSCLLY